MNIFIEKLHVADEENLFNFELENRTFFEEMIPTRGDNFYNPENFKKIHKTLLEEQVNDDSYFYLIKNREGLILGRINLVDIESVTSVIGWGRHTQERELPIQH